MTEIPPTTPYPTAGQAVTQSESRKQRRRLTSGVAKLVAGALAILLIAGFGGLAVGTAVADNRVENRHHRHDHHDGGPDFDQDQPPPAPLPDPAPPTTAPEESES